ncbi:helix-turn-helix domain-containing protein [Mesorhizobium montanum]|uniref:helix-turn-helix domain-containing protein n=1 Tax=Mesorhizobium montanum TaxID=3072323 RepID=UPI003D3133EC
MRGPPPYEVSRGVTIREAERLADRYIEKVSTLLSPAQAAAILAVTTKHLLELTNEGALRWVNIGLDGKRPTRRYKREDLSEFIEKRSQRACRYTENTANQNTPMTSSFAVIDFSAPPARAISARRNGS